MKPEAQRIAIAEAVGVSTLSFRFFWREFRGKKWVESPHYPCKRQAKDAHLRESYWCELKPVEPVRSHKNVPDYLNDLNAMHEAEKTLTYEQHASYWMNLKRVVGTSSLEQPFYSATAVQRAEAFLRTLNLWKE